MLFDKTFTLSPTHRVTRGAFSCLVHLNSFVRDMHEIQRSLQLRHRKYRLPKIPHITSLRRFSVLLRKMRTRYRIEMERCARKKIPTPPSVHAWIPNGEASYIQRFIQSPDRLILDQKLDELRKHLPPSWRNPHKTAAYLVEEPFFYQEITHPLIKELARRCIIKKPTRARETPSLYACTRDLLRHIRELALQRDTTKPLLRNTILLMLEKRTAPKGEAGTPLPS